MKKKIEPIVVGLGRYAREMTLVHGDKGLTELVIELHEWLEELSDELKLMRDALDARE